MFYNIYNALEKLNDTQKTQLNLSILEFDGFDQRDDKHYWFHEFLHNIDRYNYIPLKNSH